MTNVEMTTTMISEELRAAIKNSKLRQYQLAARISAHPSTVSNWVCGIRPVRSGDTRVVRLGRLLGLSPQECFAPTADDSTAADERGALSATCLDDSDGGDAA
jgi:transcriptional regulator with XRE-family HTH domain